MCHHTWCPDGTDAQAPQEIEVPVADGGLPGYLYQPETITGGPCLVLPDIYGTVPFYHEVSRRLSATGRPTLLVDYAHHEGALSELTREAAFARRSCMDERRAVAEASSTIDHLQSRYRSRQVGVVGFCLGGLFALVLPAQRSDLVSISYYGFPEGIPAPCRVQSERPLELVAQMKSPILAFWGADDHSIPMDVMTRFGDSMEAAGKDYEAHIYPGVPHGFLQGMVEERDDSEAARASWDRTLEVFDERLKV